MSIWSNEQWVCACGWHNIFLRTKCRKCAAPRPTAKVVSLADAREAREKRRQSEMRK